MNNGIFGFPGYSASDLVIHPETTLWMSRVTSLGASYTDLSTRVADSLLTALKNNGVFTKIVALYPFLGVGINAARVPLIDKLVAGVANNTGFVTGDFTETTGLANPTEAVKYFDTGMKASQLEGANNVGGIGWWENNIGFGSGTEPVGAYNNAASTRFCMDLRSTLSAFRWGNPSNGAQSSVSAVNGHYYGQRSSSISREIYLNGNQIATNTTSDSGTGSSERNMWIMGNNASSPTYWKGRCACCYFTLGNLSAGEVAALHTILDTYLITPTGR